MVDGIALAPEMQGKGAFGEITREAYPKGNVFCLRTQNPHMYRALEKYCLDIYPGTGEIPPAIREMRKDLADQLECEITDNGVIKGYYGGLFYGKEPRHERISGLFDDLGMDLHRGDSLLVIGAKYACCPFFNFCELVN